MQRLARYPFEKANRAMMTTKAQSWRKTAVSLESLTLHNMTRGMKTRRENTTAGNQRLSFDGCTKTYRNQSLKLSVTSQLQSQITCNIMTQ